MFNRTVRDKYKLERKRVDILKSVLLAILQFTYGAVIEIVRDQQLKRATDRVNALEGYLKSKTEVDGVSADLQKEREQLEEAQKQVKELKDKLAAIKKFNGRE